MRINTLIIVVFLIICNLAGREIFVSPQGNDLNSGVRNAPLATVTAAVGRAAAVNGRSFPALPGFAPGYFKGKTPDAGALQYGESMQNFIRMHKLTEVLMKKFCR